MKPPKFRTPPKSTIITVGTFMILGLITLYGAWYANYYLSSNSDDLVYPYLFQHFKLHDIILPGQHSNILKFPLFILQSLIPYNFTTFTIVNLGLVLVTTVCWALLLVWLFGRRYVSVICLALGSVLLGSQLFNYDLLGTTIRNVEFPIVLAFTICAGLLLRQKISQRKERVLGGIVGLLFALTIAGDSFFLITICLSLLVALGAFWYISRSRPERGKQPNFRASFLYILGSGIGALVIREGVSVLGIAKYYNAAVFKPHILAQNHIAPSITTATTQLLNLFDANIFGQNVSPSNGLAFLNFGLLVLGLIGIIYMLCDSFIPLLRKGLLKRTDIARTFTFAVMSLSFFVTYIAYIVSDLVVIQNPDGTIASRYQDRYLTLLPLVLIAGIAYLLWRKFRLDRLVFIGLPVIILVGLLITAPYTKTGHTYIDSARQGPIAVVNAAEKNHIPLLITGYWYGASTRFWSHNHITFASIAACNLPEPTFNNRLSWYKPDPTIHSSALVIVHKGADTIYWNCPDDKLKTIYGTPQKIIQLGGPEQPALWVYNYDVRSKLLPMTY